MTNVQVINMSVRISHIIMNLHYVLVLTTQRESKVHHFFSPKPSNLTTQSEVLNIQVTACHIQYLYMLVFISGQEDVL